MKLEWRMEMKNLDFHLHYSWPASAHFHTEREAVWRKSGLFGFHNWVPTPFLAHCTDVSSAFLALPIQTTSLSLQYYQPNLCHDEEPPGNPGRRHDLRARNATGNRTAHFAGPRAAFFSRIVRSFHASARISGLGAAKNQEQFPARAFHGDQAQARGAGQMLDARAAGQGGRGRARRK